MKDTNINKARWNEPLASLNNGEKEHKPAKTFTERAPSSSSAIKDNDFGSTVYFILAATTAIYS